MKFVDFKKDLEKGIAPAYLISGSDRFLCYSALDSIKKALNITMPELNEVIIPGDSVNPQDISKAASVFPFIDSYRLIQINDYNGKAKNKGKNDDLINYLKEPLEANVLVFFNLDSTEALKPYLSYLKHVDCDKLDTETILKIMFAKLKKQGVKITVPALEKVVVFCNNDMSRISNEIEKLISFSSGNEIQESDVELLVYQDKEYQVFELAEYISKGEKDKAIDMVYTLTSGGKSGFSLLGPLYNNYRRALYVAINKDKTDEEIADMLGVKPYAIKMVKNQVSRFTPKKLKTIVDMLYNADRNIKMGKIKEEIQIKTVVLNILKIRG